MRTLLIEDEAPTSRSLQLILDGAGFSVEAVDRGEDGIELAKLYDYDVILLALSLPDMSGLDVVRRLRNAKVHTPVIFVSGSDDVDITVQAFSAGADDYVVKPFRNEELLARARAVARRAKGHAQPDIRSGELVVRVDVRRAEVGGRLIHLTNKEYQVLEILALRKGSAVSKEMFLLHLYEGRDEPEIKIIDVFVCKLRKKLAAALDGKDCIETIWGRGYAMRELGDMRAAA